MFQNAKASQKIYLEMEFEVRDTSGIKYILRKTVHTKNGVMKPRAFANSKQIPRVLKKKERKGNN